VSAFSFQHFSFLVFSFLEISISGALKAQQHDSPGRRPGETQRKNKFALKGQNKDTPRNSHHLKPQCPKPLPRSLRAFGISAFCFQLSALLFPRPFLAEPIRDNS
jgi:hypothetical protein